MQSASPPLLRALIPTHPTTFLLRCGCFAQILFVSIRDVWLFLPDHIRLKFRRLLGFKNQCSPPMFHQFAKHLWRFILILMYLFCQAIQMPFYKFTGQQPKFFTLPVVRRILLNRRNRQVNDTKKHCMKDECVFCSNYRTILKSIVLL